MLSFTIKETTRIEFLIGFKSKFKEYILNGENRVSIRFQDLLKR